MDLDQQIIDFDKFGKANNFCICSDLNMTFSDNYYYTKTGRQKLNTSFGNLNLVNTTAGIPENIILSKSFIENRQIITQTWNMDKKVSDHIGVSVDII